MRLLSKFTKAITGATGRTGAKLVAYALVCVFVLLYIISLIGNVHFFEKTKSYKARLSDATGLLQNDSVKIAGVEIGKVTGIHLDKGTAIVTFQVRSNVRVPKGTGFAVRWRNLLGQKYLYLYPPPKGGPAQNPKKIMPISDERQSADIGKFLNAIGPVLSAIDPKKANEFVESLNQALDGNDARVRDLLSNAAQISNTVGGLDTQVGSIIDNLSQVLGALAARNQDLVSTISNLKNLSGTLADHSNTITTLLDQFTSLNHQIDALLNRSGSDFTSAITNLQTVVNAVSQDHGDLDKALSTLPAGLLGYFRISRYGQWFQVRSLVTCIVGDTPGAAISQPCPVTAPNPGFNPSNPQPPTASSNVSAPASSSNSTASLPGLVASIAGGTP